MKAKYKSVVMSHKPQEYDLYGLHVLCPGSAIILRIRIRIRMHLLAAEFCFTYDDSKQYDKLFHNRFGSRTPGLTLANTHPPILIPVVFLSLY